MVSESRRFVVKIVINPPRAIGADAGHLCEIRKGRVLDRLQCTEMHQKRALAGGPDPRNFLQPGFADIFLAARPM